MALIRGLGGLYPCPRCLVPKDQQLLLAISWPKRCAQQHQAILNDPSLNLTQRDKKLKQLGLRDVSVCYLYL